MFDPIYFSSLLINYGLCYFQESMKKLFGKSKSKFWFTLRLRYYPSSRNECQVCCLLKFIVGKCTSYLKRSTCAMWNSDALCPYLLDDIDGSMILLSPFQTRGINCRWSWDNPTQKRPTIALNDCWKRICSIGERYWALWLAVRDVILTYLLTYFQAH
jgi:hypothetical protein